MAGKRRGISGRSLGYLGNDLGAPDFILTQDCVAATASYTVVAKASFPFRVVDVWAIQTGGAGAPADTITVNNDATAITDALDMNVADKVVVRAGTIDDAQHKIAKDGALKVATVSGAVGTVYIRCIRVEE